MACLRVINPKHDWDDNRRCFIGNVLPEIWTHLEMLLSATDEIRRDPNLSELISFCCRREYVAPLCDSFFQQYRHHLYKRLRRLDTPMVISAELQLCPAYRDRAKQLILAALPELQYSLQVHFNLPSHFLTMKLDEIVNDYEERLKVKAAGFALKSRLTNELGFRGDWRRKLL